MQLFFREFVMHSAVSGDQAIPDVLTKEIAVTRLFGAVRYLVYLCGLYGLFAVNLMVCELFYIPIFYGVLYFLWFAPFAVLKYEAMMAKKPRYRRDAMVKLRAELMESLKGSLVFVVPIFLINMGVGYYLWGFAWPGFVLNFLKAWPVFKTHFWSVLPF